MVERLGPLEVPILEEFGFGHVPSSPTLPLGVPLTLDADAGTLAFDTPALT